MSKNIQRIKKNLNIVLSAEGNNDISLLILRVTTGLLMFFCQSDTWYLAHSQ